MHNLIRTASLELQLTGNQQVVKVAGILNKLKNYLKQLGDQEYADAVSTLRSDSWMLQQVAGQLRKKIKELTEAIDDGDIASYDLALEEVRSLTAELASELKQLNQDAQQSDPRVQDPAQPLKSDAPDQGPPSLGQKYTREQWDDPEKRAALFDYTARKIKEWHPNHDVPLQKNINKPVQDFEWFKDKEVHIKEGNESGARNRLIDQTAKLLVRETSVSYDDARATFEDPANFAELARRLVNAIYNGTLLHYFPASPQSEPKDKSKTWVKERQIGEMAATVKTADFTIPVYDVTAHMTVGLIDMGAPLNGTNKLVLGFTEYPRVLAGGVPPALRKGFQPKAPAPVLPEPVAPEPVAAPPPPEPVAAPAPEAAPIVTPPAEEPPKQKQFRKRKTSALRLELFKSLVKQAKVNPNAAKQLPESFWVKFVEMSNRLGADPEHLAQVINSESAFDPHATNEQDGRIIAKGLNQLVEKTAKRLGMSDQEWRNYENLPAEEQLKYVEKFFKTVGRATGQDGNWTSATQLYVANFAPKYVRQASNPNTVLYSQQENKEQYEKNKGLDRDKKGHITAGDLAKSVSKKLPDFIKQAIDRAKGMSHVSLVGRPANDTLPVDRPANDTVDNLLTTLFALDAGPAEKMIRQAIQKKKLPTSQVLVTISSLSSPYQVRMKFARAASAVLKDMIDADVTIHSDGNKIELQCSAVGSQYAVASAVKGLCDCVIKAAEIKLNSGVRYAVLPSVISKYAEVKQ